MKQSKEPSLENINTKSQKKDTVFETTQDSIMAIKESVLRKQNSKYKKKK